MKYKIIAQHANIWFKMFCPGLLIPSFFLGQVINFKKENLIVWHSHEYITTNNKNSKIEYI